jgi:hypothetical protein
MTLRTASKARTGGMGAVAPMVTGRPRTGYTRRGLRAWLAKASPARPGQQKRSGSSRVTTEAEYAAKRAQP